jgi:hypothetical protein
MHDDVAVNKTLLAMLLALGDLKGPLTEQEQATFNDVAYKLHLNPNAWESDIVPNLLSVLQTNSELNQLYLISKSQLDAVGNNLPHDLLPTSEDIEKANAVPTNPLMITRGFLPVTEEPEIDSSEINNLAINIFSSPKPQETVKQLSRFEQLKQFLQNSNNK